MTPQITEIDVFDATEEEIRRAVEADNDHFHYVTDNLGHIMVAVPISAEIHEVYGEYYSPVSWALAYGGVDFE